MVTAPNISPTAFCEKPVLKLIFGAMIRAAEGWRAIKLADFERRQLAALSQISALECRVSEVKRNLDGRPQRVSK